MSWMTRRDFLIGAGVGVGAGVGGLAARSLKANAPTLLRPPGALAEPGFLATCIRCGQCAEACPYDTLALAGGAALASAGTPYVDARQVPCYLCQGYDELKCIAACPSGALQEASSIREIRMGTAVLDHALCVAWNDVVCRACWHACPLPNEAIVFDGRGRPVVNDDACIGCGLCDHACLTEPSAIPIRPAGAVT